MSPHEYSGVPELADILRVAQARARNACRHNRSISISSDAYVVTHVGAVAMLPGFPLRQCLRSLLDSPTIVRKDVIVGPDAVQGRSVRRLVGAVNLSHEGNELLLDIRIYGMALPWCDRSG